MKLDNTTLKDIARALNLSTSTVSRALRGSYEIGAKTKKQVLEYAEKMNYRPNPVALSLKEKRTRSIGVVISEIANNFFSQAINGIESIAYNRGYHVIISQAHESAEREKVNIQHLAYRGVDGMVVSLSGETVDIHYLKQLHEKGLPMVFFDRITDEIDTFKVVANNYLGTFQATEHLISQGYRQIAHITNSPVLSNTRERIKGYRDALQKHGFVYNEQLVKYCHHGGMVANEIQKALKELMALPAAPDAVFTSADRITTQCLSELKKTGRYGNLGFVGFTNTNMGALFFPSLTFIRQPAFQMGQTATELLIRLIESKRPITEFETKLLDTELVIGESSRTSM